MELKTRFAIALKLCKRSKQQAQPLALATALGREAWVAGALGHISESDAKFRLQEAAHKLDEKRADQIIENEWPKNSVKLPLEMTLSTKPVVEFPREEETLPAP